MEIIIRDDTCWICGTHKSVAGPMTTHHTLPKHLNPKKNVTVPVCEDCHGKLNKDDSTALIKFACKIDKTFKGLGEMVSNMIDNLKKKGNS